MSIQRYRGPTDGEGKPLYYADELENGTTGRGAVVLATEPTIDTPTITAFTNANHDHEAASGGGLLDHNAFITTFDDLSFTHDWNADADSTANGSTVQNWSDSIGGNTASQSTAGSRPTMRSTGFWGRALQFDSDYYTLTSSVVLDANFAIIAVGKWTADSQLMGSSAANRQVRVYRSSAQQISIFDGTSEQVSNTVDWNLTHWNVITWRVTSDVLSLYVNGMNVTNGTTLDQSSTFNEIMACTAIGQIGTGFVKRLLVKTSALSDADMLTAWRRLHHSIAGVHGA